MSILYNWAQNEKIIHEKQVSTLLNGINGEITIIRNMELLDFRPFSRLRNISVRQIPYLAKGAVLPANKPFLAMVGDQKHGTIQDAVALVMNDL